LNKTAFDYQIQQLKSIKYGELLEKLNINNAPQHLINKGKPIERELVEDIWLNYQKLNNQGLDKRQIIDQLSRKYGRGYWSLTKIINSYQKQHKTHQQEKLF